MIDAREVVRVSMKAILDRLGCYDAAAATINARFGGASKGTISKKVSGVLDWTVADVLALEDATGQYPVTRFLARRLETRGPLGPGLMVQSGVIARESGEAVSAILAAEQSSDAGERAEALKEIDEAIEALSAARARIEGVV